ncbi:MAG: hypothetical protein EPGJADBJ_02959 [Saprospiraceae bacterium]|nr:hypothetical protein [Saprospiraceae bacterium]
MTSSILSCLKPKGLFPPALLLLLFLMQNDLRAQNCNPDVTAPIAVCNAEVFVSLDQNGQAEVNVSVFDAGSVDACCLEGVKARRFADGPCDADNLPDNFDSTVVFCCADIGTDVVIVVRATDCSGNFSDCWLQVIVEDKIKPAPECPPNVTVSCENFDPSLVSYGVATAPDNCCLDTITKSVNYSQFDTVCTKGTITRIFVASDCSGNSAQCTQRIEVNYEQDYFIRFPDDLIVTDGSTDYGEPEFFGIDCEQMGVAFSDHVFTNVPDADLKIERTWSIISWCGFDPFGQFINVPNPQPEAAPNDPANLPGPVVSSAGTPAPWAPTVASILPGQPATDYSTFYAPNANGYEYKQIIKIMLPDPATVSGKVFQDTLDNCLYNTGEPALANWPVKITGLVTGLEYETLTNSLGEYSKEFDAADTLVEVTLAVPFNFGQNCPSVHTLNVASGQTTGQDIAVKLASDCPLLSVDISAPFLRRCFANTYTVQACNLSNASVAGVYTEVALDSYLEFNNSSIPGNALGNNTWSFDLGDLEAGECTSFQIFFDVDCAAPIGYTHCTEAHIFPDTVCNVPANWSGADLKVTGFCDADSVRLTIANIGSGDMAEAQDFVVVEDVVMYTTSPFQLNSGESVELAMAANGATWRLETEEVPYHPWGGVEAKAVEGCGGLNQTGLVTLFSFNTPDPFEAIDCQENVGSFDPNDKRAYPKGYGAEHFVEANTDLEYHIRFQNTGTDTAFTVVVLDTLSQHLDATTVRPGASSHEYNFAVLEGNVLRFRFDHILLPDSNVNEKASHGFVKFRVAQNSDNPDGTRIENRAAIYFDFNDPVLTNTTFHTIGDHFIVVKTDEPGNEALRVYPNPTAGTVFFEIPEAAPNNRFQLTDNHGKTVMVTDFSGKTFRFEKGQLPPGVYFFRITSGSGGNFSGKVILKQ